MSDLISVSSIRAKFPAYQDLTDEALIGAIRRKFYADIPMNEFVKRIDFDTERERLDPTKDNSFTKNLQIGFGKGLTDFVRGVGQLTGVVSRDDIKESRKYDAPLMKTGGGMIGTALGQAAPMMVAPGVASVPGAIGYGALEGFIAPSESDQETAMNTGIGAVGSGVVTGGAKLIGKLGKTTYKIAEPHLPGGVARIEGRTFNELAGDKAPQVIAELQSPKTFVRGSVPNAGETAVDAGSAPFTAAQELLKDKFKTTEYAARQKLNEEARRRAITSWGKDKSALDAAVASREAAAKPLYEQAKQGVMPVTSEFRTLMGRPQFKDAVERARIQAKNEGIDDIFFRDTNGRPIAMLGDGVHYIKKALDDAADRSSPAYLGKQAAKSANTTTDEFLKIVDPYIPEYGKAKSTFASMSPKISRMEIGQFLENKLASPIAAKERPGSFMQAMRDAPGTVKRAAGGPPVESLDEVLTNRQSGLLGGIVKDLNRGAEYDRLVGAGRKEASDILGEQFKPVEPYNFLHRVATIGRSILERIEGKANKATLEQMALDMQNPQRVAELMKAATPQERPVLEAWLNVMKQTGGATSIGVANMASQHTQDK